MPDGMQAHEPMRRPRGRHADVRPATAARTAVPARLLDRRGGVPLAAVASVSLAAVAVVGGALTFTSMASGPAPDGRATTVVGTQRPGPTDPGGPSSFAPILPSGTPAPSADPSRPAPPPSVDEPAPPVTEAPVERPAGPVSSQPPPSAAPGPTNQPDPPTVTEEPQDCDERDGLLGLPIFGPRCP